METSEQLADPGAKEHSLESTVYALDSGGPFTLKHHEKHQINRENSSGQTLQRNKKQNVKVDISD